MAFDGRHLVYQNADTAHGAYGQALTVTLIVADTLGNTASHAVSFALEKQAVVASNLFVFGSVAAQRAGQQLSPGPLTDWIRQTQGPVPADGADPWFVIGVTADTVTLSYVGAAPVFTVGAYITNKNPRTSQEIFYRKILSVNHLPAVKLFTLGTTDVPVEEIVEFGTCSSYALGPVMDEAPDGTLTRSSTVLGNRFGFSHTFSPPIGVELPKDALYPSEGNPKVQIKARDVSLKSTFTIGGGVEIANHSIQAVEASVTSDVVFNRRWSLVYHAAGGAPVDFSKELHTPLRKIIPAGFIGPVPIFLVLEYTTNIVIKGDASADISLDFGMSESYSRGASLTWRSGSAWPDPKLVSSQGSRIIDPISLTGRGEASVSIGVEPRVELSFMKLAGAYLKLNPRVQGEVTASGEGFSYDFEQDRWNTGAGNSIHGSYGLVTDFSAGLMVTGMNDSELPRLTPVEIPFLTYQRTLSWPKGPLQVTVPGGGMSRYAAIGDTITLDGQAVGGTEAIRYKWFQNGRQLLEGGGGRLTFKITSLADAGNYKFVAKSGEESVESPVYALGVGQCAGMGLAEWLHGPTGQERQLCIERGESSGAFDHVVCDGEMVQRAESKGGAHAVLHRFWCHLQDRQQCPGVQLECEWLPAAHRGGVGEGREGRGGREEFPLGHGHHHAQPGEL